MNLLRLRPLAKLTAAVLASSLIGVGAYGAVSAQSSAPPPEHHDAGEETVRNSNYLPAVQSSADIKAQAEILYTVRVYVSSLANMTALLTGGFDVLEGRGIDYLLVQGDAKDIARLKAKGFRVEVQDTLNAVPQGVSAMTYYGGYRTVAEHVAHLNTVASTFPNLTTVVDYGQSWRKVHNLANGNDLFAICITNKQVGDCALNPTSTKPRFLLVAAIHARELTTAEMAYRWIDYLTQNYGTDADVTALLNYNELWVIPVLNPDGRTIVESGGNSPYLQRKNANNTVGTCSNPPTSSNQYGVDLNRNASTTNWGGAGTSTNPCDQTYKGVSAASEPEQYFLEQFITQLFPNTKGPNRNDPAATTTKGAFITLHTYSNLVLLPYGDATTGGYAPNDVALRSLAFRMSFYNGYQTGTGDEILYATTGTTDDWTYGKLGVPGFTFEMGPSSGTCSGFTPTYSCQDGTFWPLNRPAFLYMAKNAREPYVTPFGPTSSALALSAGNVPQGTSPTLTANLNDNAYGNASGSVGRPTAQNVVAAEYYVDAPPWAGGTAIAMSASDGAFNSTNENVTVAVNTSNLSAGKHTLFVRGRNAGNNWGAVSAIFLTVTAVGPTPTNAPTPTQAPTNTPTTSPTSTNAPTPTQVPTNTPTTGPTPTNTSTPTQAPTNTPTTGPTPTPTNAPTQVPTNTPTTGPTPTPTNAPTQAPTNTPTPGPVTVFSDDFETNKGWTTNASGTDTAVSGFWERGVPEGTSSSGVTLQLGAAASGSNDLVTARLAGSSAGAYDVDGGITTARSPSITLPSTGNITLTLKYYLAHLNNSSTDDFLRVKIVGNTTTTVLNVLGAASNRAGVWTNSGSISLNSYAGQTIYIQVECADNANPSLVEAGIDDVLIQKK